MTILLWIIGYLLVGFGVAMVGEWRNWYVAGFWGWVGAFFVAPWVLTKPSMSIIRWCARRLP